MIKHLIFYDQLPLPVDIKCRCSAGASDEAESGHRSGTSPSTTEIADCCQVMSLHDNESQESQESENETDFD